MNVCEISQRCQSPPWYQVRVRYKGRPTMVLMTETCRRHLSIAVEQALTNDANKVVAVTVSRVPRG